MTEKEQLVWRRVDQQREAAIGWLAALVQASRGGEEATQAYVADKFKRLGCDEVEIISADPRTLPIEHESADPSGIQPGERISVAGRLSGAGVGRSLLLWAHPDSSPVGDTEGWQHDPFAGQIEDGRMYGWGVSDDLIGVAIMACALEAVLHAGLQPQGDVILASAASKGRAQGIIALLERGYGADASIYLHPAESGAGLGEIKAMTSAWLTFRITVPGHPPETTEPGHEVFFHQAVNPLDKAWVIYQALQKLDEKRGREVHHPVLDEAIGRSTNLGVTCLRCGDEEWPGLVSPECVMTGFLVCPPGEQVDEVQIQVVQAVEEAAAGDDWLREHRPRVEWLSRMIRGTEVPVEHPLYQTVSGAIEAVTGIQPRNYPLHPGSDIRNPTLHSGIPTVGFGPLSGDSTQIGGWDEWIDVEDYVRALKVVGSIIVNWCGV